MSTNDVLTKYGWDQQRSDYFHRNYSPDQQPGRVIRVDRTQCDVATNSGVIRVSNGKEHALCTGDWVVVDPAEPKCVAAVLPRGAAIRRSSASDRSEAQVLAANIDLVLVVDSLTSEPDLGRMERLMALAWESGATPLAVLTKADLVADADLIAADVAAAAPGIEVIVVSATSGQGMAVLRQRVAARTSVLLGRSGVGKSTLANTLLGTEQLAVGAQRAVDGKGRHTTVTRELVLLPESGAMIDTPGLRAVGLWQAADGLDQVFQELTDLARECHFTDCAHDSEPGCAVQKAIVTGDLHERRLISYRKLQRENEWMASRTDARLRKERTRKWKVIHKAQRARRQAGS